MKQLNTIQKRENLNEVYAVDEIGNGNANHLYLIVKKGDAQLNEDSINIKPDSLLATIQFQNGPRKDDESIPGVLDTDLLEIVRDRLKSFQEGEFATRENAIALTHIENALLWMNKRVEDRISRGVLGTNNK